MNFKNTIAIEIIIFTMIIVIGGSAAAGGIVLPIPQPPALPPLPSDDQLIFADERLAVVFPVIQKFKNIIISDPFNITATWVGSDICSYRGFYCESPPDNKSASALASIDFNGFQLTAPTLVGFLDSLPDLALFHANSNNFAGAISPAIGNLKYLYELDLSNNKFAGAFPAAAVLGMTGLSFLDLRFNFFSGSVPPQLFFNTKFALGLDALFLNNNNFLTRFPDDAAAAAGGGGGHIAFLTLANNKFFGPIPRSVSRSLSNISEILLVNNMLSGCLPHELGLLTDAVVFDGGGNRLTGSLPVSLGCLRKLEVMNFAGNLLYGSVPEIVCGIGSLANLSLSDNYFTRVGPVCLGLMKSGVLDLRKNCVPGLPLQRSWAECGAFFARPRYCVAHAPPAWWHGQLPCSIPHSALSLSELAPSPT
ncbi:hypothetical protein ABFS83_03G045400 [Erythranthe nasuta]